MPTAPPPLDGAPLGSGPLDGPPSTSAHGVLAAAPAGDGFAGAALIPPVGTLGVAESGDGMRHAGNSGSGPTSGGGPAPEDGGAGGGSAGTYPNLVAALVAFLNLALQPELGSSDSVPKVFADCAPPGPARGLPWMIVHDTDEHEQRDSTGTRHVNGHIYCVIKHNGKAQAHNLGERLKKVVLAAEDSIGFDEGTLLEICPMVGSSTPITETPPMGIAPYATERTIGLHYMVRYDP